MALSLMQRNTKTLFGMLIVAMVAITFLLYMIMEQSFGEHAFLSDFLQRELDDAELRRLMAEVKTADSVMRPLADLYLPDKHMLHFYELPKLKLHADFTEITSANRDSGYPLAPDFTMHIDYGRDSVVIYEDHGPGCIFRIYLFPVLPREVNVLHSLKARDLANMFLLLSVDDQQFKYSLQAVLEGTEFPFLHPMSATHAHPASGLGAYVPLCYSSHMRVSYVHSAPLPRQLLQHTANCSANDLPCSTHIYAAVSRHKYAPGQAVASFADPRHRKDLEERLRGYAAALKKPLHFGPDKHKQCLLTCTRLCPTCTQEVFADAGAGVIAGVKVRVYRTTFGHPRLQTDWNHLLLTARFDSAPTDTPQVDAVPLGALFGVTGSLNGMAGAAMGHGVRQCAFDIDADIDFYHNFSEEGMTGYMYLPMPYWTNASVRIQGTEDTPDNTLVCYQFDRVGNHFPAASTGYFHAGARFYADDVSGFRTILSLDNMRGHVVGVWLAVDNLRARRNVPLNERWALLQADHVLYLDHRREAAMLGTGLEDYFSYAHGFALAENTTYAFVGNYHAAPKRKEPLTWHSYRLHVLDPIPFHGHVHFVMEGTDRYTHFMETAPISHAEYGKRLQQQLTSEGHVTLFYARGGDPGSAGRVLDSVQLGDTQSELAHALSTRSQGGAAVFRREGVKYLGQVTRDEDHSVTGRSLERGDTIAFTLRAPAARHYSRLALRRRYHTPAFASWNQRAKVWVNARYQGLWFSPMGATSDRYSLREADLLLDTLNQSHPTLNQTHPTTLDVRVQIQPESDWNDIQYQLIGWT